MSNTSLEKFYNDLIPNLWEEVLFYIPDNSIPIEVIDKFDNIEVQKIFNKIWVVDYRLGPIVYEKGRDNKKALFKGSILSKNIYSLLEKKSSVKSHEFDYVLEKYFIQVECLFYVTNWMNMNLNQMISIDDTLKGLVQLQFKHYKKHFEDLLKQFYPSKDKVPQGNFNIKEIIETYFPEVTRQYDTVNKKVTSSPAILSYIENIKDRNSKNTREDVIHTQPTKKLKKQPLITEKEAEDFLLESVFKVKLKNKI
jgi:hypothetical protein